MSFHFMPGDLGGRGQATGASGGVLAPTLARPGRDMMQHKEGIGHDR